MSAKALKYRSYKIVLNQTGYTSMMYKLFDKKTGSGAIATIKAEVNVNKVQAHELHKPVIKRSKEAKSRRGLKTIIG